MVLTHPHIDNNFMNVFVRRRAPRWHGISRDQCGPGGSPRRRNETATLEQLVPAMWDYRCRPVIGGQGFSVSPQHWGWLPSG